MRLFKSRGTAVFGILAALAVFATGCAKETTVDTSGMAKAFIDSWMSVNHPGVNPTGLGVYILEDTPGAGAAISDNDSYLFINYTTTDLDGNISATTYETVSQRLGTYKEADYYGPNVLIRNENQTQVGVLEMLKGMRVGGTRTALIPGWLNVYDQYSTPEEYIKKSSGTNVIHTINLVDKTSDIVAWEIDTLSRYVAINMAGVDSTKFGYYCKTLKQPESNDTFASDTTFWINYTGRLLNGKVFDTTIADTAKVYGIYSPSKTYAQMCVNPSPDSDYTKITISSSSAEEGTTVVDGFSFCLSKLRPYEKVVCAFYSPLGYSYSGSGTSIPKFAPIVFEIEVVDAPLSEQDL